MLRGIRLLDRWVLERPNRCRGEWEGRTIAECHIRKMWIVECRVGECKWCIELLLKVSSYLLSLNAELASLNEAMMAAARYDRSNIQAHLDMPTYSINTVFVVRGLRTDLMNGRTWWEICTRDSWWERLRGKL